jgi:hypothetical protein
MRSTATTTAIPVIAPIPIPEDFVTAALELEGGPPVVGVCVLPKVCVLND